MASYVWDPGGALIWSDPKDWAETAPTGAYPAGPPGSGDTVQFTPYLGSSVGGSGAADYALISGDGYTFTGTFSFTVLAFTPSVGTALAATIDGGSMSASQQVEINYGATVYLQNVATLDGPTAGSVGFDNFGTVSLASNSGVKTNFLIDGGLVQIASGLIQATTFEVTGYSDTVNGSENGSLVMTGGSLDDTLGIVGNAITESSSASIAKGTWSNQQLLVGSAKSALLAISQDATVSVSGGFAVNSGVPEAFGVGLGVFGAGGLEAGHGSLSVADTNSRLTVTGDAAIGHSGTGDATITAGGIWDMSGSLDTAYGTAGAATLYVGSGGALVQVGGGATIADVGTATATVDAGGSLTVTGSLVVANSSAAAGSLLVSGGLLSVGADLLLGNAGAGSMTLTSGGTLSLTGTLDEGVAAGGSGTLAVTDAAVGISIGGDWIIGNAGAHSDSISAGAQFTLPGQLVLGAQSTGSGTLDVAASSAKVTLDKDLTVGQGGIGSLHVGSGATIQAFAGTLDIGAQKGATGSVVLDGNGSVLRIGKSVTVGDGGTGTLSIGQYASVDASGGALSAGVGVGASGTVLLGAGVTLAPGADALIGGAGAGSLDLAASASLNDSAGTLTLGRDTGGSGIVSFSGTAAEVSAQSAIIGGSGGGTITLGSGDSLATSGDVTIGAVSGSSGLLSIGNGGNVSDGGDLVVGGAGGASLDVNGGTLGVSGSAFVVGQSAGANADATIAAASLDITGTATIGSAGTATLSLISGGTLGATAVLVGDLVDGNGAVSVDGGSSRLTSDSIVVGGHGVGALQALGKAVVTTAGNATIGRDANPVQQSATFDTKAGWQIGGDLEVGLSGNGILAIQGAATVQAGRVVLGDAASAVGEIDVSGTNSALTFGSALVIGGDGGGTLSIAGGAHVGPASAGAGTIAIGAQTGSGNVSLTGSGSALEGGTLDVGSAGGTGTLAIASGAAATVSDATIAAGSQITLTGGALHTDPVANQGTISGYGTVSGAIANSGRIIAQGGTLTLSGAVSGSGTLAIATGADLVFGGTVAAPGPIQFQASNATLTLASLSGTQATIAGFAANDRIQVLGVTADGVSYAGGVLTVTNGGTTVGTLAVAGYTGAAPTIQRITGGVEIDAPCFVQGTRIATTRGAVAVEDLRPGMRVRLAGGGTAPVRWLGHRRVTCARHPRPHDVLPIAIAPGAFGQGRPARTLRLSPDHAVFTGGALIPVRYLLNGATIVQERCDAVTYWHVELDRHGVLLAENLPAESYLDTGNRAAFANGGTLVQAHPDFARAVWTTEACAPLVLHGPRLAAARTRLLARAAALGHNLARDPALVLRIDGRPLPARRGGGLWQAALPPGAHVLHLVSRTYVPAEIEPEATDTRRLGVALAALALDGAPVEAGRFAAGWHAPEAHGRWTDGVAALDVGGARSLSFRLVQSGRYWLRTNRLQSAGTTPTLKASSTN